MIFRNREHFEEMLIKAVESDLEKAGWKDLKSGWRTREYLGRQVSNRKMREPVPGGPTKVTYADGRTEIIPAKEPKKPKVKKKNTKTSIKPTDSQSTDKKVVVRRAKNNTEND
jgi:hypothetical protein